MEGDGDRIRIVVMGDNQVRAMVWDGLKYEIVLDFDYLVPF